MTQTTYLLIGLAIGSPVVLIMLIYAAYLFAEEPANRWEIGEKMGEFYKAEATGKHVWAYVLAALVAGMLLLLFWLPIIVGGLIYGMLRLIRAIRRIQKRFEETG